MNAFLVHIRGLVHTKTNVCLCLEGITSSYKKPLYLYCFIKYPFPHVQSSLIQTTTKNIRLHQYTIHSCESSCRLYGLQLVHTIFAFIVGQHFVRTLFKLGTHIATKFSMNLFLKIAMCMQTNFCTSIPSFTSPMLPLSMWEHGKSVMNSQDSTGQPLLSDRERTTFAMSSQNLHRACVYFMKLRDI